jgi:hypothetical protein
VTPAACTITATEGTLTGTSAISVIPGTAIGSVGYTAYTIESSISTHTRIDRDATDDSASKHTARSLDAGSQSGNHIYDIAPTGSTTAPASTVTLRTGDPRVPGGTGSENVGALEPTGRYFYTMDENLGVLNALTISQEDGTLTPIDAVTNYGAALINTPTWLMINRTGKFMYVVNDTNEPWIN